MFVQYAARQVAIPSLGGSLWEISAVMTFVLSGLAALTAWAVAWWGVQPSAE